MRCHAKAAMVAALMLTIGAATASAQTGAPTDYRALYYQPGATQPMQQSDSFAATAAQCNQAPLVNPNTVNPTRFAWADLANAGRVCVAQVNQGGALFSLPVGPYEAVLVASNAAGASPESNRASFSRAAAPGAPQGFQLVR